MIVFYKRNCLNCYWGSCGNIIDGVHRCFCRHIWGETDPDKISISHLGPIFIVEKAERKRQPEGVLKKDLAEEMDCAHHEWDSFHPALKDHQPELFERKI